MTTSTSDDEGCKKMRRVDSETRRMKENINKLNNKFVSNDLSPSRSALEWVENFYHVIYFDHVSRNDGDELKSPLVVRWGNETGDRLWNKWFPIQFIHYFLKITRWKISPWHASVIKINSAYQLQLKPLMSFRRRLVFFFLSVPSPSSGIAYELGKAFLKSIYPHHESFSFTSFLLSFRGNWHYRKTFLPFKCAYYKYSGGKNEETKKKRNVFHGTFFPVASRKKRKRFSIKSL